MTSFRSIDGKTLYTFPPGPPGEDFNKRIQRYKQWWASLPPYSVSTRWIRDEGDEGEL